MTPEHGLEVPGGIRHLLRWGLSGRNAKGRVVRSESKRLLWPRQLLNSGREQTPTTALRWLSGFAGAPAFQ